MIMKHSGPQSNNRTMLQRYRLHALLIPVILSALPEDSLNTWFICMAIMYNIVNTMFSVFRKLNVICHRNELSR